MRQVSDVVRLSATKQIIGATQRSRRAFGLLGCGQYRYGILSFWAALVILGVGQTATIAQAKPLAAGWLKVNRTSGSVMLVQDYSRSAKVGDRLHRIGDALKTGPSAAAILQMDDGIGTINVAENTHLEIRKLNRSRSGARLTTLDLKRGQVRLNVRKFTNPESRLEIRSPAGVAAVRGTEYGISISEDGRMVVATESGLVTAANGGTIVYLEPDFGSRLRPQELPSSPLPLDRKLWLKTESTQINARSIYIQGQVDPLNRIFVAGSEVTIDDAGYFEAMVPLPNSTSLHDFTIVVSNALGESRSYPFLNWTRSEGEFWAKGLGSK